MCLIDELYLALEENTLELQQLNANSIISIARRCELLDARLQLLESINKLQVIALKRVA